MDHYTSVFLTLREPYNYRVLTMCWSYYGPTTDDGVESKLLSHLLGRVRLVDYETRSLQGFSDGFHHGPEYSHLIERLLNRQSFGGIQTPSFLCGGG